jgi:uridine kinase
MRYAALAEQVLAAPGRLGTTRLVAVDGPSASGKTSFAGRLARATGAQVVHTDDLLDGWADQLTFWPRLEEQVLQPLRSGAAGGFHAYDWSTGRRSPAWTAVPPAPVLILEGVSTARSAIRPELGLAVFVTAPIEVRVARSLARDGRDLMPAMDRWRAVEDEFFARDETCRHAGLVVDGAPAVPPLDPATDFVLSQPARPS